MDSGAESKKGGLGDQSLTLQLLICVSPSSGSLLHERRGGHKTYLLRLVVRF